MLEKDKNLKRGNRLMKRKYKQGERITSLDELYKQEFIWHRGKVYHKGWFRGWQFQYILDQMFYCESIFKVKEI